MTLALARIEQQAHEVLVELLTEPQPMSGFYACEDLITGQGYTIFRQNLIMIADENIPQRFAEKVFARVAPHIGEALRAFPHPIIVRTSLSANTLARVLQEALTAKRRYNWTHPTIDERLWSLHNARLGTARQDAHAVAFGPKETLRATASQIGTNEPASSEVEVANSSTALRAIAELIASKLLVDPPRFFVRNSEIALRELIENQYDIVFHPDDNDPSKFYIV